MAKKNAKEFDERPNFLAGVAVVEDSPVGESPPDAPVRPSMSDPAWESFVCSQFAPGETVEKDGKQLPKANALWRVCEKLVGTVVLYEVRTVKGPTGSRDRCAVVEARLAIRPHPGTELALASPGQPVVYEGVGDATEFNTNEGFDRFAPRVAETRAKGRACRAALRLHATLALEEMVDRPAAYDEAPLTSNQVAALDATARRLNLNVARWIVDQCRVERVSFEEYGSIGRLPRDFGSVLCRKVAELRDVPAAFQGYDPNWRGSK